MGRVWLAGEEYVPATEVAKARLAGRDDALRTMGSALAVTWLLLLLILLFVASASGAYAAGPCGTG